MQLLFIFVVYMYYLPALMVDYLRSANGCRSYYSWELTKQRCGSHFGRRFMDHTYICVQCLNF